MEIVEIMQIQKINELDLIKLSKNLTYWLHFMKLKDTRADGYKMCTSSLQQETQSNTFFSEE